MMSLSKNEYFTRDMIRKISQLINIPEETISTIITAIVLYVLEDCREQTEYYSNFTVHIPRIGSVYMNNNRTKLTYNAIQFTPEFMDKLSNSVRNDHDYLTEFLVNGTGKLIVDKFLKVLDNLEEEDK